MENNTIVESNEVLDDTKKAKTPKEKTIFGLEIAGNVVFYAIILALLLFSIMNINAGSSNGGFPNIFGHGYLSVQSNSMSADLESLPDEYKDYSVGQFDKGDMIYVDVFKAKDINKLKVGDIVTFFDENLNALNSHRIVYMTYDADGNVKSFSLQGDYSASIFGVYNPTDSTRTSINYDLQSRGDIKTFTVDNVEFVKGKVTGVSFGTGKIVDNIKQNWGWFFVLPIAIVLLVELFFVIKNIITLTGEKQRVAMAGDKEKMMADLEAQKEAMRAQILAELKAQEEANASKEEKVLEPQEEVNGEEKEDE